MQHHGFKARDRRPTVNLRLVLTGMAAVVAAATGPMWAGSGSVMTIVPPLGTVSSGLMLVIDTQWADGNGYRPVRVTVSTLPTRPAVRDIDVRVELWPNSWGRGNGNFCVTQHIEIPEGAASATATISVPQNTIWSQLRVDVWKNGQHAGDISRTLNPTNRGGNWNEARPVLLVIDSDAPPLAARAPPPGAALPPTVPRSLPDVQWLTESLWQSAGGSQLRSDGRYGDRNWLQSLQNEKSVELLAPEELPVRWINLTCFDVAYISIDDLALMKKSFAPQWKALRDWAATGPTLCVDVGDELARLDELEKLLGMTPAKMVSSPPFNQKDSRVWWRQHLGTLKPVHLVEGRSAYAWRQFSLGQVVAFGQIDGKNPSNDSPFVASDKNDPTTRTWWYRRHGLSQSRPNDDFWNLLIPGTGSAPVNAFRILITLFVIVIGPANYFYLRRRQRLSWLLVTIPAGAAVVTAGLVGYALLTDGLGTRVRVRSFTQIDQRHGRAVSWSRQSYYAGLAPSRGLSYPADTAVYPLDTVPHVDYYRSRTRRYFEWDGDQRMAAGYMASRVTTQMLAVRTSSTEAGLTVTESAGAAPSVANRLGTDIVQLLICDSSGNYFWADDAARDKSVPTRSITAATAAQRLRETLRRNAPKPPDGFDMNDYRHAQRWSGYRRYWVFGRANGNVTQPTTSESLLEENLSRIKLVDLKPLEPRSYIAVTRTSPEVPLGVQRAREDTSFHVISGRW